MFRPLWSACAAFSLLSFLGAPSAGASTNILATSPTVVGHLLSSATDTQSIWAVTSTPLMADQFSLATGALEHRFPLNTLSTALTPSGGPGFSDGRYLYYATATGVGVLDEATGKVVSHVSVPGYLIAMTSDGTSLFTLGQFTNQPLLALRGVSLVTHRLTKSANIPVTGSSCGGPLPLEGSLSYLAGSLWASVPCSSNIEQVDAAALRLQKVWQPIRTPGSDPDGDFGFSPFTTVSGDHLLVAGNSVLSLKPGEARHTVAAGKLLPVVLAAGGNRIWGEFGLWTPKNVTGGIYSLPLSGSSSPALRELLPRGNYPAGNVFDAVPLFPYGNHCWVINSIGAKGSSFKLVEFA